MIDAVEISLSLSAKRCRILPSVRSNLIGIAEALPDLHRHIPRSPCARSHVRRGDAKTVRVDTVGGVARAALDHRGRSRDSTSPREQLRLFAGIDIDLHQPRHRQLPLVRSSRV